MIYTEEAGRRAQAEADERLRAIIQEEIAKAAPAVAVHAAQIASAVISRQNQRRLP